MKQDDREFLFKLVETPSPTGFEMAGQQVWSDWIRQHAAEVDCDSYGSTWATLPGKSDRELSERLNLTSAYSINLARLVPQSFYYLYAARQLPEGVIPTFVIPSGNFGNLTAGLLAMRLGLPVDHFVAATNRNDVVPGYLTSGTYLPRSSVPTISNAMDVGALKLRPHAGALRRLLGCHENPRQRHDLH